METKKFYIRKPLDWCIITQPFGVNYVNFYQKLGMKGHNAIDLKAYEDTIYAPFDGIIKYAGKYSDGGIGIEIVSDYKDKNGKFKAIDYHLKSVNGGIRKGQHVLGGQPMGISNNTGKYTTANHLHFGLKRCDNHGNTLNYNNGYRGAIDPTPYLQKGFYDLPVHKRYGQAYSLLGEIITKTKYPKLRKEQLYGMVYGSYKYSEIINPSLRPIWAFLRREEYLAGKQPQFKLSI